MRAFIFALFFILSVLHASGKNVYEVLSDENFTEVVAFLDDPANAGLKAQLSNATVNTTIFAPLSFNATAYKATFTYHLVSGILDAQKFTAGFLVDTQLVSTVGTDSFNQRAKFSAANMIQGATFVANKTFAADNGAIFGVDMGLTVPADTLVAYLSTATKTTVDRVVKANLTSALGGVLTVFSPTDDAWAKTDDVRVQYLASDAATKEDLTTVLTYHVSATRYYADMGPANITTLHKNAVVEVTFTNGTAKYGNAKITDADELATNGVAHLIDTVQIPADFEFTARAWFSTQPHFKNFLAACEQYPEFNDYLDGKTASTILAPTDSELKTPNVSLAALQYHFVTDGAENFTTKQGFFATALPLFDTFQLLSVTINDKGQIKVGNEEETAHATRVAADVGLVAATAIYSLDDVLEAPDESVADVVKDIKEVSTLYSLISGLPEDSIFYKWVVAPNASDITVFAPLNSAFEQIPAPYLNLLSNPNETAKLEEVLNNHAVATATIFASDITDNTVITTLGGLNLTASVNASDGVVTLTAVGTGFTAEVTNPNLLADNGVAHAISNVLIPSDFSVNNVELLEGLEANTYLSSLNSSGLLNNTKYNLTTGDYFFFAPTDDAFKNLKDKDVLESTSSLLSLLKEHILPASTNLTKGLVNGTCYPTITNGSICARCDSNFENWQVFLKGNDIYVDIAGPEPTAANTTTSLLGYSTFPEANTYAYSLDGVLGEEEKKKKKGLGSTEIGLIVAGCIVAVLLAGAAVGGAVWYYRKNSNKDYEEL